LLAAYDRALGTAAVADRAVPASAAAL
jgi:hypothetical protein